MLNLAIIGLCLDLDSELVDLELVVVVVVVAAAAFIQPGGHKTK